MQTSGATACRSRRSPRSCPTFAAVDRRARRRGAPRGIRSRRSDGGGFPFPRVHPAAGRSSTCEERPDRDSFYWRPVDRSGTRGPSAMRRWSTSVFRLTAARVISKRRSSRTRTDVRRPEAHRLRERRGKRLGGGHRRPYLGHDRPVRRHRPDVGGARNSSRLSTTGSAPYVASSTTTISGIRGSSPAGSIPRSQPGLRAGLLAVRLHRLVRTGRLPL